MSSIPFSAPDPPEYLDAEETLMRGVVGLRVAWESLDPEAMTRVKEKLVTEFFITTEFLAGVYERLRAKFAARDTDEWRGDTCECGAIVGAGAVHECRSSELTSGQRYIDIGR